MMLNQNIVLFKKSIDYLPSLSFPVKNSIIRHNYISAVLDFNIRKEGSGKRILDESNLYYDKNEDIFSTDTIQTNILASDGEWKCVSIVSNHTFSKLTLFNNFSKDSGINAFFGPIRIYNDFIGYNDHLYNHALFSNYYYDITKTGISYHCDLERLKVIGIRLGHSMPLCFQWFEFNNPIGTKLEINLEGGDIYIMSEIAKGIKPNKKKLTLEIFKKWNYSVLYFRWYSSRRKTRSS